ncbi:MAG: glycosyltransferase family 39 protein [Chloroflexi bacterium]|nr:glycosyltransferase family 39 protein [Chloroflexota bacterium]MCL5076416.1 glycosyltransferase family 39 protein [Chloroflexota bacterium]
MIRWVQRAADIYKKHDGLILSILIFLIALLPRLAFAIYNYNVAYPGDDDWYRKFAVEMQQGRGMITDWGMYQNHPLGPFTYGPPGYIYFLAAIYTLFGYSVGIAKPFQSVLDAVTCLLIFLIGDRVFGRSTGLIAALLFAIYSPFIQMPSHLQSEPLFLFLLYALTLLALRWGRNLNLAQAFSLGMLFGYLAITRGVLLLLLPLLLLWLAFSQRQLKKWIINSFWLTLAVALVYLPPTVVKSYQIHGVFVATDTHGGYGVWAGVVSLPGLRDTAVLQTKGEIRNLGLSEASEDRLFYTLTEFYLRRHPQELPQILLERFNNMFLDYSTYLGDPVKNPGPRDEPFILRTRQDPYFWYTILILGLLGMATHPTANLRERALLYAIVLSQAASLIISQGVPRYRLPIVPVFMLTASYFLVTAWSQMRNIHHLEVAHRT